MGDIAAGLAIGLASAVLFFMQARAGLDSSTSEQEREAAALLNQ